VLEAGLGIGVLGDIGKNLPHHLQYLFFFGKIII
jgi:hypothetical protein